MEASNFRLMEILNNMLQQLNTLNLNLERLWKWKDFYYFLKKNNYISI